MDSVSVVLSNCNFGDHKQKWTHEKVGINLLKKFEWFLFLKNGTIIHHPSKLCLDVEGLSNNDQIKLKKCESNKLSQQWLFEHYAKWWYKKKN